MSYSNSVLTILHRKHARLRQIFAQTRTIFQKTGKLEKHLTVEMKKEIESFWRPRLAAAADQKQKPSGDLGKYYVLSMFPYPSGRLHMGHVRVYAISDAMARYRKMQGYEVLHPMGWDAFGLPAENAAVEQKLAPHFWTEVNIKHMKKQLMDLGFGFDWDREIRTCDPAYYKWTQFLFLKLWKAGLAYQKEAFVNWDPVDETVLANEQVDENGCSWRSGAKVEKKLLRQWFLRTSHYSTALNNGLQDVPHWRDIVALQQNWIGDICGNWITFDICDKSDGISKDSLKVFSRDIENGFDAAFIALAPTHEFCAKYKADSSGKLNVSCTNPYTGKQLPVFICSDENIFDKFCDTHLGIPSLGENSAKFARTHGLTYEEQIWKETNKRHEILEDLKRKGIISPPASAKLKDWLISRQRYWGTPIPAVHCSKCGTVPVPYEKLPVVLPVINDFDGKERMRLSSCKEFLQTECPSCNGSAERETDTMDTFVDSSWYYLRFLDPHNDKAPFRPEKAFDWMPVDVYIGGKEHALMHLFYARFIGYFLHDQGLIPEPEPFKQLLAQGFVMGRSYKSSVSGRYLKKDQLDFSGKEPLEKSNKSPVIQEWEKMSKSRYNGLDPDEAVEEYGIDATRLFMLGNISPRTHRNWDPELFKGLVNWQRLLWMTVDEYYIRNTSAECDRPFSDEERRKAEHELWDSRNYYLKGVNNVMDKTFSFNMAIAKLQGLSNTLRKVPSSMIAASEEYRKTLEQTITMLFPFCPHFSAELWSVVRSVPNASKDIKNKDVWEMPWPQLDRKYPLDLSVKLYGEEIYAVKLPRDQFDVLTKESALEFARAAPESNIFSNDLAQFPVEYQFIENYEAILDVQDRVAEKKRKKEKKAAKEAAKQKKAAAN